MTTHAETGPIFLPICLNIAKGPITVIGGGRVAKQKLATLIQYTMNIRVAAKNILPEIRSMDLECLEQEYASEHLSGAMLVFACTNDSAVNHRIATDARARRIPVCVADDPAFCDFVSPAIYKREEMSVAVSSNAKDVRASVAWRNRIREIFENDPFKGD